MNKFEQLIEYVINDEEQKARELFHDIIVAKSRAIYENLMQEEAVEEAKKEEEEGEEEELDEAKEEEGEEEELDENMMGGDAQDNLVDEVSADETRDMSMEDDSEEEGEEEIDIGASDDMGGDMGNDMGGDEAEPATKGDVMDLGAKIDELMAEFEERLAGSDMGGDGDNFGADEGGDAIEVDDTEEMMPVAEAVTLKAAPKPVTSEEGGINKKSTVAANSGAAGMAAKPVHATGTEAKGRPAPTTKDLITDFQNKAGAGMKAPGAAPKPHTAQATGVNTKSPLASGRKG